MSARRVEKSGERSRQVAEPGGSRSTGGTSEDSKRGGCPNRQQLLGAYETAVRAYYKAVAAIRRASFPVEAIAAARQAYLASEDARTALERHERDHSCVGSVTDS